MNELSGEDASKGAAKAMNEAEGMAVDQEEGTPGEVQCLGMAFGSWLILGAMLVGHVGFWGAGVAWGMMLGALVACICLQEGVTLWNFPLWMFIWVVCVFVKFLAMGLPLCWISVQAIFVNVILVNFVYLGDVESDRKFPPWMLHPAGFVVVCVIWTRILRGPFDLGKCKAFIARLARHLRHGREGGFLDAAAREDAAGGESGDAEAVPTAGRFRDGDGGEIQASGCCDPVDAGDDGGEGESGAAGGDAEVGYGDGGGVQQNMK
jgi:hypothetical protein